MITDYDRALLPDTTKEPMPYKENLKGYTCGYAHWG